MGIFNNKIDEINPVFRLISNALNSILNSSSISSIERWVEYDPPYDII